VVFNAAFENYIGIRLSFLIFGFPLERIEKEPKDLTTD
jgi:hypothetical protein